MVLATKVGSVDIHTTVIRPVVGQGYDELDAHLRRSIDDLVEGRKIDSRLAVLEALEDNVSVPSTFVPVPRKAVWIVGDVLVVKAPSAKDGQAGIFGGLQPDLDV